MVVNMSLGDYLITLTKAGIKRFIGLVTLANRSYNMNDYHSDTTTASYQSYKVGQNNLGDSGTQHKLFISKSTLIMCTQDVYLKFNHSENVIQTLLADTYKEFKHDIKVVSYAWITEAGTIYIEAEGVLPEEGRVGH